MVGIGHMGRRCESRRSRIETGLLHGLAMTFIAVLVLLPRRLPGQWMGDHIVSGTQLRARRGQYVGGLTTTYSWLSLRYW